MAKRKKSVSHSKGQGTTASGRTITSTKRVVKDSSGKTTGTSTHKGGKITGGKGVIIDQGGKAATHVEKKTGKQFTSDKGGRSELIKQNIPQQSNLNTNQTDAKTGQAIQAPPPKQAQADAGGEFAGAGATGSFEKSKTQKVVDFLSPGKQAGENLGVHVEAGTAPIVGLGGAGKAKGAHTLTNKLWKSIVNKQPKVGTISKTKGIVQTNTKTTGIINKMFSWLTTNKETVTYTDANGVVKVTSMVKTSATKPLVVVGATLAAIAAIAQLSLGGKNFKNFLGTEEAAQAAGMSVWIAADADNYDAYWEARALQDEALDPAKLNESIGNVPYANTKKGIEDYVDIARRSGQIMDDVMRDKQLAEESGMDKFQLAEQRKLSQELFLMDAQDQINRQFLELKKNATVEQNRQIEASMAKQRELERQETEWTAQYWMDYKLAVIALENANSPSYAPSSQTRETPSALNFGLL